MKLIWQNRFFNWYSLASSYLSLRLASYLVALAFLIGIFGYMGIEGYSLREAFYMTAITISTVGYTEVHPLSPNGQLFTSIFIIINLGIFAYAVSAFTSYIIHGEFFRQMHVSIIKQQISQLKNHIILCGYGRYGKEVVENFLKHNIDFVIIEKDPKEIEEIQKRAEKILYIEDDATHDDVLQLAGIHKAKALISALGDDTENVFTVLTARQLSPTVNIISRSLHPKTESKLRMAGANHVISPEQIGGFYMATIVNKPAAIDFFSFITNEYESDIGFEEITYENLPNDCKDKSIRDLKIRKITGANIIGFRNQAGKYTVNPSPETVFVKGTSFIVLGDETQLEALRNYFTSPD
ncbi:MAG: potassium channel protein [Saprospiraceae bacterium]